MDVKGDVKYKNKELEKRCKTDRYTIKVIQQHLPSKNNISNNCRYIPNNIVTQLCNIKSTKISHKRPEIKRYVPPSKRSGINESVKANYIKEDDTLNISSISNDQEADKILHRDENGCSRLNNLVVVEEEIIQYPLLNSPLKSPMTLLVKDESKRDKIISLSPPKKEHQQYSCLDSKENYEEDLHFKINNPNYVSYPMHYYDKHNANNNLNSSFDYNASSLSYHNQGYRIKGDDATNRLLSQTVDLNNLKLFDNNYTLPPKCLPLSSSYPINNFNHPKSIDVKENQPFWAAHFANDSTKYDKVIEISGFPAQFNAMDIKDILTNAGDPEMEILWVDDGHALAIFSSITFAQEALKLSHPLMKCKTFEHSSAKSKTKAEKCLDSILATMICNKPRPKTTIVIARRFIEGHLGKKTNIKPELREQQLKQFQIAIAEKKKSHQKSQQVTRDDVWDDEK